MKTTLSPRFKAAVLSFCAIIVSSVQLLAGPTFLWPKNVEPTISVKDRKSGFRFVRKEWKSLQINTTFFEIAADKKQVLVVVVQNALGTRRVFSYVADSGYSVTVEHPVDKDDPTVYTIEKNGEFADGFRFTVNKELEPFTDEQIRKKKDDEKIINESQK